MEATPGKCRRCAKATTWPDPWSARALNRLCEPCQRATRLEVIAELSPD